MRPRTKLQFEVLRLSHNYVHRNNNTYYLQRWAQKEALEHKGFATKKQVHCMDCGCSFSPDLVKRGKAECPNCYTKLTVEETKKRTDKQKTYFAYAELCDEFQVVRYYKLESSHKVGQMRDVQCYEVYQLWLCDDGKCEVVGLNHTVNHHYDSWNGEFTMRNKNNKLRYSSQYVYDTYTEHFHPDSEFKKKYCKYGINRHLAGITFREAVEIIPKEPKAETLLKAKQYRLLSHINGNRQMCVRIYWHSIKICMRNKYKPVDAGMWLDYLGLLDYFGKDTRNAHYVCPKNLKREHDRLVDKKRIKEQREAVIRKREEDIKNDSEYRAFIEKFLDLEFGDKKIRISPLKSVAEFKIESDVLRHCVFQSEYFKRPNCLILSAKIEAERIETIEVNLEKLKVEQCRGYRNENSKHHDRILRLVNRSIGEIKKRLIV